MRSASRLSAALLALALSGSPALADADGRTPSSTIVSVAPTVASEVDTYAVREVADRSVADFRGGESVTLVASSAVLLVLVIILIVILL